jgi:hypothetical protein
MYCSIIPSLRKNWNSLVLTYLMKNEFGIEKKKLTGSAVGGCKDGFAVVWGEVQREVSWT